VVGLPGRCAPLLAVVRPWLAACRAAGGGAFAAMGRGGAPLLIINSGRGLTVATLGEGAKILI